MLELLIKNAEIIDGTGTPGFIADVGIADQRIARIATNILQEANQTIIADGLTLTPGFIDPHMHSDLTVFNNRGADSSVHQGVTTEIIGNCGMSAAPMSVGTIEDLKALSMGIEIEYNWTSMAEYLECLEKPGIAVNMATLLGHSNVRSLVMGYENRKPTLEQQLEMGNLVKEGIEQGAFGLSTGLFYPPGLYADLNEIISLAKAAAKHGRIYASHVRNESEKVLAAVEEAIEIGIQAEIQVECSHVKICGFRNWKMVNELIRLIESDRAKDAQLGCDLYPYTASSTFLSTTLPYWAQEGGGKAIARRMIDEDTQDRIRKDWQQNRTEWDNRKGVRDWNSILITDCVSRPEVTGKSIAEIAIQDEKNPLDVNMDLVSLDEAQALAIFFDQNEEIMISLMKLPCVIISSDSMGVRRDRMLGHSSPHPRCYGTFPRVLGRYVREKKILSLPEAIYKMTCQSAERYQLTDRGVIREDAWADIVLFDAQVVNDKATFTEPHQYPEGISYVIVNGTLVLEQGKYTGALPGHVL
jgi:N-acyl-D-amino-acid deacylase